MAKILNCRRKWDYGRRSMKNMREKIGNERKWREGERDQFIKRTYFL